MLSTPSLLCTEPPLTAKELELLETIGDLVGSPIAWPSRVRTMFFSTHLRYSERVSLTFFLLANRMPPIVIAEWYLTRDMLRDKSARDHVASIIDDHKHGNLAKTGKTAWVVHATENTKMQVDRAHPWDGVGETASDRVQLIETPSFASEYQNNYHWDQAVQLLKHGSLPVRKEPRRALTYSGVRKRRADDRGLV